MSKTTGRRGRNEGSIYQRVNQSWAAVVDCGWKNGRRVRKSLYGKTRKEVQGKLTKALRDQQLGMPLVSERETVGRFLTGWLEGTARPRLRARTFADYGMIVTKHLIPQLGNVVLSKLGPEHVRDLLRVKSAEGLSARRVRLIRAVLHTALNEAVVWGRAGRNAANLVKPPRTLRHNAVVLNQVQVKAFLAAAGQHRLGPVFCVAVGVGLRLGEALGLQWVDVDLERRSITVRQALQLVDKRLQFVEPKSEASRRTLPLPNTLVQILTQHRATQATECLKAGARWRDGNLVFASTIGSPLDDRNVRRAFKALLVAAKLPTMRIHDLRHTCATLLLAQGAHPKVVQSTLGHSQISLTMDTYSTVLPSVSVAAAELMDAVLRQ